MDICVYTDGAAIPNPGRGGWAAVFVVAGQQKRLISGYAERTTNNEMELRAAIEAVKAFKQPTAFTIATDSQYVVNSMTTWIPKRGYRGYANADHFAALIEACAPHTVTWRWVRAHNGDMFNEIADHAAYAQALGGAQCPECSAQLDPDTTDYDFKRRRMTCGKCGANFDMVQS